MKELTENQVNQVAGGIWAHIATAIAIADAGYDFWQGYSDARNKA